MIPSLAPLANHLWQSTLFAGVAPLLALALRKNDARVRHGLWLAASCKFLIPISLLIALGDHVRWRMAPESAPSNLSLVADEVSRPFAASPIGPHYLTPPSSNPLTAVLILIWACGFLAIAFSWWVRWRRIRALVRTGSPVELGIPVSAISSATLLEPGVCGILRPVVLLPEGIVHRLTPAQLQAVLSHELCHIRHHDNLIASLHMFVETVFWFHPLIWWIGKRMLAERERACDEEVLRLGNEPRIYVEGILNVCKLYLESPLACVSGIAGSDLKQRVRTIMTNRTARKMSFAQKIMLAVAATAAFAIPLAVGIMNAPPASAQTTTPQWQTAAGGKMAFDVASIHLHAPGAPFTRPSFPISNENVYAATGGSFIADFPVTSYITFAYKLSLTQEQKRTMIGHLPNWVASDSFVIRAKSANSNPTKDQMRLMMQSLLADRFHLALHFETRESPVFALALVKPGKPGPKLIPHADGPACDASPDVKPVPSRCDVTFLQRGPSGSLGGARNMTLNLIASGLQSLGNLDRPVLDRTGLNGYFDYLVEWTPEPNAARPPDPATQPDLRGPNFQQALHDQLGLKLEPAKAPIETLVIDHIERPSEN